MSLISAFGQIRLSGSLVTISGGRVQVAGVNTLMVSDSGNFVGANVVASTGQQAWGAADANGRNLSGNLGSTGQALYNDIINLSGQQQNLTTLIPTGSGSMTVYFSPAFPTVPIVVPSFVVFSANSYAYGTYPTAITTASYICQFSDTVLESGNFLQTIAHV